MNDDHGTVICRNMKSNMEQFNKMKQEKMIHSDNFLEVDYDSWMKNLTEETPVILRFLGIDPVPGILKDIMAHFSLTKPGYLSTYRGQAWDTQRWRGELGREQLEYIMHKCGVPVVTT